MSFQYSDTRLEKFKDKYLGERCFVLGTSSSLRYNDLKKLEDEFVFAPNWFPLHKDYQQLNNLFHCVSSSGFWNSGHLSAMAYNSLRVNKNATFLWESSFYPINRKYRYFDDDQIYYITLDLPEGLPEIRFPLRTDITKPIWIIGSVIQDMILPIVYYMGFKSIYLVGCDCSHQLDKYPDWSASHFYNMDWLPPAMRHHIMQQSGGIWPELLNDAYIPFKALFEAKNRIIKNATTGGFLEVFERIEYDSLFT